MKISVSFDQDMFLRQLHKARLDLDDALERMSTGVRVRYASDDPQVAGELLRLADESQKLTMRQRGISQARPWLQLTERGLTELGNILASASTYAMQGASDILQPEEKIALAEQIHGLREQVEGIANLKLAGRYIFSGTLTEMQPFDASGNYQGNSREIEIPLDDVNVSLNLAGDQVFGTGSSGALAILDDLEAALRTNDTDTVQNLLEPLDDAISANAALLARVGTRLKMLDDADVRIGDRQLEVAERANALGAADLAQAISDVQKFETGYNATLAAGARLFGPTFFDYLG